MTIYMRVNGDSMEVVEALNFSFNRGNYSMAYREIPHEGFDSIEGARVDNASGFPLMSGATYEFDWFKGKYTIRWPFPPQIGPSNTTFFITYVVEGGIKSVARDQLGFDWDVVGKGWSVPIKKLNVYLYLPMNVSNSPLFDYSPSDTEYVVIEDSWTLLTLERENIHPNKPVRFIVYFPKTMDPKFNIYTLMRENSMIIAALIFFILMILSLIFVIWRHLGGRIPPRTINPDPRITRDPAKLATLLMGRYHPIAFFASLVNLSKMGFARIFHDPDRNEIWVESLEGGDEERGMQLGAHDIPLLNALGEPPLRMSLANMYKNLGRSIGESVLRTLKNEGFFSRQNRSRISLLWTLVGSLMAIITTVLLYVLIMVRTFEAVAYGGFLLGTILGGISIFVILGLFLPKYTARGNDERSQQAAFIDKIMFELETASLDKPREVPVDFDKHTPLITAATYSIKGRLSKQLRKIAAQAPDEEYFHPWYDCTTLDGSHTTPFGIFGNTYSDTLEVLPSYMRRGRGIGKGGPPAGEGGAKSTDFQTPSGSVYSDFDDAPVVEVPKKGRKGPSSGPKMRTGGV